jgi:hypothetical protein
VSGAPQHCMELPTRTVKQSPYFTLLHLQSQGSEPQLLGVRPVQET